MITGHHTVQVPANGDENSIDRRCWALKEKKTLKNIYYSTKNALLVLIALC